MHPQLAPLHAILELNTRLVENCLEGVDDRVARTRPSEKTNSIAFIALHLADARDQLGTYLGCPPGNYFPDLPQEASGIDDLPQLPSLARIRRVWREVSDALSRRLGDLSATELQAPSPIAYPVEDNSVLGGIAFMVEHDSYHVGQLAFLRKHFGLGPMRYTRPSPD